MKLFKDNFSDEKWDLILIQWVKKRIHPEDLKELKAVLSYDNKFREQFCDWKKSLRGKKTL